VTAVIFLAPLIGVFVAGALAVFYFRASSRPRIALPGAVLAGVHLALVIAMAAYIASMRGGSGDPSEMAWLLFYAIDMPVSLLLIPLSSLTDAAGHAVANYWVPLLFFALLGSAQYFAIGLGVSWLVRRKARPTG